MERSPATIRDRVEVRPHPTVVRLDDLDADNAEWLSESFVITSDLRRHLSALRQAFGGTTGCGIFVIGHYGCGKSHFLAYLIEKLRTKKFAQQSVSVVFASLVNYGSDNRLEDIVGEILALEKRTGDRRQAWKSLLQQTQYQHGLVLILDELSEFLRSKADDRSFTEDVRFLQFMGEWAQKHRLWVVAAMQEAIEHTGELEYSLYRKIKDRYPLHLLLPSTHVRSLIADSILIKKPGYENAVGDLFDQIHKSFPDSKLDRGQMTRVYPLHPATLDLLEEVRDRFSQARGIVDFTVARLMGNPERDIEAFLDQPWGALVTPDLIVDHFSDLFELQPEFMPLAQKVLPWYRRHLAELFANSKLRILAEKLLKLLILIDLSPARDRLSTEQAAEWLLFSSIQSDPSKNRSIVQKVLTKLVDQGQYVSAEGDGFRLNLENDSRSQLDRLLNREIERLPAGDELILESLVCLLGERDFNPFVLPRNQWQSRKVRWHFHDRDFSIWLGEQACSPRGGIRFCLRPPWGPQSAGGGLYSIEPETTAVGPELRELAALLRLAGQALSPEIKRLIEQRIEAKQSSFAGQMRMCWSNAVLVTPEGNREPAPRLDRKTTLTAWLENIALLILRRSFPAFERFAPAHGPLPKEAIIQLMRFSIAGDIVDADAGDYVRLIREGYLVPMGLLRRQGREYRVPSNLDKQELVTLLMPMLKHSLSPEAIHQRLSQPIYGLVPDQINLLLIFLLIQGEVEILKARHSYRDTFETLPNPLSYDCVQVGHALSVAELNALSRLAEILQLKLPKQWSVLAQKRMLEKIREMGRRHCELLEPLERSIQSSEGCSDELSGRLSDYFRNWNRFQQSADLLEGFTSFLTGLVALDQFLADIRFFQSLQQRLPALLDELNRYRHLFHHACLQQNVVDQIPQAETKLHHYPALDSPDDIEKWLLVARSFYKQYKTLYTQSHQHWWQAQNAHPALVWQPPVVAASQHLGLQERLATIRELQQKAAHQRCRELVNLDYQPQCSCGFDGQSAPLISLLQDCANLQAEVDQELISFFREEKIKQTIRDWQNLTDYRTEEFDAYLKGESEVPQIRDLSWFERNLSADTLVAEVDVSELFGGLEDRDWEPQSLLRSLEDRLRQYPGRLRFKNSDSAEGHRQELALWCAEQCLRFGAALPERMSARELQKIDACLRPDWVSHEALTRLEQLGLSTESVDRIIGWMVQGQVSVPQQKSAAGTALFAVQELLEPDLRYGAQNLALLSESLYRYHRRFLSIAGKPWLERVNRLAEQPVEPCPLPLTEILDRYRAAQWLVLDCWGLALYRPVLEIVRSRLHAWQKPSVQFAMVGPNTNTDDCYRQILDGGFRHSLYKCNAIDKVLHQRNLDFADFAKVVTTELEIELDRVAEKLDANQDLLIFSDHGFRLDRAGRKFQHGGDSTLERVVPVCMMSAARQG